MTIRQLILRRDWFKAVLMYLATGDTFRSFVLQYDIKGYEKDVQQAYKEVCRCSTIKKEWYVQPKKYRRLMGYQILADRVFKDKLVETRMCSHITLEGDRQW